MIRENFRVMVVDIGAARSEIVLVEGRNDVMGGSGLAAKLFERYGAPDRPWDDPDQPFILTIGPLTGYFPLMSKTVAAFKSPYHDQYAESHAGGRSALALRFADLDGLVVRGRADRPVCLLVGRRQMAVRDVHYLWGSDVFATGKALRRMAGASGHRSILRIGPAGENLSAMSCINVDTYRHFGRLGGGAVMGAKKLKGVIIQGDGGFPLPEGKAYPELFRHIYSQMTDTKMMSKYHDLGTAVNLGALNELKALPWRNLQQTTDPGIEGITGERFADETLLRDAACSGCPVGCIHIGFVREKFMKENQYLYRQVSYDYEPIFATGSMLGVTSTFDVLKIMDEVEKVGLDVMSAGVALAWATEATEKGLITEKETVVSLAFGDFEGYRTAVRLLGQGGNDFYRLLAQGTLKAADAYGGKEFSCVLGQEMAGYATGEVFFTAQALGFRHSHLDSGGYSYDQGSHPKDVERAVDFLVRDEQDRVVLTSLVSCLFARGVYNNDVVREMLASVGYGELAEGLDAAGRTIQTMRWKTRFATGFDPETISIPKRFREVVTWKGEIDSAYLEALKKRYGQAIKKVADSA